MNTAKIVVEVYAGQKGMYSVRKSAKHKKGLIVVLPIAKSSCLSDEACKAEAIVIAMKTWDVK